MLVEGGRRGEVDIKSVYQQRYMALFFVFAVIKLGELISSLDKQFFEVFGLNFGPIVNISKRGCITNPVCQTSIVGIGTGATLVSIIYHPISRHGLFLLFVTYFMSVISNLFHLIQMRLAPTKDLHFHCLYMNTQYI